MEIEKEIVREVARGDKPYLRKSTESAKLNKRLPDLCFAICRFSQVKVYHPEPPHAQPLFLFPIVFGINLINFFDGEKNTTGQNFIICLGFSITRREARAFERGGSGTKPGGEKFLAIESVNSLRISAPPW